MGSDNKRISKRAPVVLRIKLRYTSVDTFVQKFATNLSPGGMFISSRAPKPIGTTVKFELRLADESAVINGSGIVRWTQQYDPEHPRRLFGMGIEFTQLSEESREVIERIVEHKKSLGLPDDDDIPMSSRREPESVRESAGASAGEGEGERRPVGPQPAPLEPRAPRRPSVSVQELIARASAPASALGDEDLLSAVDGELPNLSAALSRARALAGGADDGGELDALLKVSASPVARSVADASSALAEILGSAAVGPRRGTRAPRAHETKQPTTEPEPEPEPRDAALEAIADDLIAGLMDEDSGPVPTSDVSEAAIIEARRPELDPAPLPGMPPTPREAPPGPPTPPPIPSAPMLDASEITATSSSGSIDLSDLAEQLMQEAAADELSHDLDADALDAEGLLASGVDQLITPRQRRKSEPISLPHAPDLSSFADPPTMTGADPMPRVRARSSDPALDDLDATLAALEGEPAVPPTPRPRNDFDAEVQPLLTRADGPPLGMMPPPLPQPRTAQHDDDDETDVGDFDVDIDIDIEADYGGFEPQAPQEVDPDAHARRRERSAAARAAAAAGESAGETAGETAAEDGAADDDELDEDGKKKGIFSRMFGRKK